MLKAQLATAIERAEADKIASICEQVSLDVGPLSGLLDQLNGHCSRDVISVGFCFFRHRILLLFFNFA